LATRFEQLARYRLLLDIARLVLPIVGTSLAANSSLFSAEFE
jgi:hypothetical protein